ncbi:N-acetyl-gamma-glutamyl-phosphate reductase [Verrucomicrobiales bacterium BCK34]|nr:N-acetyl-gamma-glutamyl-phosphate reductase [Verrucomicrobiales bacterium BCK34]
MSKGKINVAVIGASGYTGQELLRLLVMHPNVNLVAVTSRKEAGRPLTDIYPRLRNAKGIEGLAFSMPEVDLLVAAGVETAFLALPHGVASEYAIALLEKGIRVIDLSADFRLRSSAVYEEFYGAAHPAAHLLDEAVYGLPEVYREEIKKAKLVASPGCYPTSILVPLIPLLKAGLVSPDGISVSSLSGSSGAGKKADLSLLFPEVNESLRAYGAPKHRHLSEIEQEMSLASGKETKISFVPHLMPITAGIASTIFCNPVADLSSEKIEKVFSDFYEDSPFVRILGEGVFPDTKNVVRTNFVDIGWVSDKRTGKLILCSAEDNLGKGAGGQAIQSLNVMHGLDESTGLMNF